MATPKFHVPLSASFEDDPRVLRAGDDAELVLYRALQLAKRIGTDGVVDRTQLLRRCPDRLNQKQREATVDALISVELLRVVDTGLYIAGWLSWNSSNADIEERREKERERKARGGRSDKPLDSTRIPDGIRTESGRNDDGIRTESGRNDDGIRTESGTRREEKRREEKRRELTSPPTTSSGLSSTYEGGGFLPETRAAIARLADSEADTSPVPIGNRSAWLRAVTERIAEERGYQLDDAVYRLRFKGVETSPYAVIDEAARYAKCLAGIPGAASWGASRAELAFIEVRDIAREQWPDTPELVAAALEAWEDTQRPGSVDDVA